MDSRLITTTLATALCMVATSALAANVTLRERVAPKSAVVRLGDVADIVSADRQQARRLATVPLMPAPAPGTERYMQRREVADMLAANGVNLADIRMEGAERVAISGPAAADSNVKVASFTEPTPAQQADTRSANSTTPVQSPHRNRHAAILAGEKIEAPVALSEAHSAAAKAQVEQLIRQYIRTKTGGETGRIEFNVTPQQLLQVATSVSPPVCSGGENSCTGRQTFAISFETIDGPIQFPVTAQVSEPAAPIVVAIRPVGRGNIVTAADVEVRMLQPSAKTSSKRPAFVSTDKIIGMEVKQALREGEVVFADQVQSPIVIKRGELVTVASQTSGIRVRTSAKSLQDGSVGDLIQLESLESKQHFNARVTGLREATVMTVTRVNAPEEPEQPRTARRLPRAK